MKAKSKSVAIWSVVAAMLFLASALPSAYGVDSPMTGRIDIEGDELITTAVPLENAAAVYSTIELAASPRGSVFAADIALVSNISRQIEM